MTAMGIRSARLLLPALVPGALLAAGCGSKDSGPDPAPAADALAEGLASGDLSGVVVRRRLDASGRPSEYDATVAGLGDVKPKVEVDRGEEVVGDGGHRDPELDLATRHRLELPTTAPLKLRRATRGRSPGRRASSSRRSTTGRRP